MDKEIVPGVYQFQFPTRFRPNTPATLSLPVVNTVEGFVTSPTRRGFRFLDVPTFQDGFAEYDPRVVNLFRWEGLDGSVVRAGDRLIVSISRLSIPLDPDSPAGAVAFPPVARGVLLPTPLTLQYVVPPGFFGFGTTVLFEVTLERSPGFGIAASYTRLFQLPIRFVNLFPAAMSSAFAENTPASKMTKTADPDGDGISNWLEWLSNTDPNQANTQKNLSSLSFVPPSSARSGGSGSGHWEMSLDRPSHLPTTVSISVQSSPDLKTWTAITDTDPQWEVIDDREQPQLRVISKTPGLAEKRYFRVNFADTAP